MKMRRHSWRWARYQAQKLNIHDSDSVTCDESSRQASYLGSFRQRDWSCGEKRIDSPPSSCHLSQPSSIRGRQTLLNDRTRKILKNILSCQNIPRTCLTCKCSVATFLLNHWWNPTSWVFSSAAIISGLYIPRYSPRGARESLSETERRMRP